MNIVFNEVSSRFSSYTTYDGSGGFKFVSCLISSTITTSALHAQLLIKEYNILSTTKLKSEKTTPPPQ